MSDTPETDAFFMREDIDWDMEYDMCRQLERERDALKKHISIMDACHKIANDEYFKLAVGNENLERERDAAQKAMGDARDILLDAMPDANAPTKILAEMIVAERDLWKENSQSNRDEYYRLAAERDKFSKVIASFQDTVFDLRAERDELKCKLDEARSDLEFRRGLYKLQTEQLNNANLRVERTRAYLEEIKSERDLWKLEAERWRDCEKP